MLDKIDFPSSLKGITQGELVSLCNDIRYTLIDRITKTGGHMGSNLAVVELTVALHYVFNAPFDKIVYDISHQTYVHKILTGRKHAFLNPSEYNSVSGYTNPSESEYDLFRIGHTSTSLSLAHGLIVARDRLGGKENVISVIGDGALSGGEALEGLNNLSSLNSNCIVILNDNEMSIAENVGGIYKNLKNLRDTNGGSANNLFTALGFNYVYVEEGNDVLKLIETLKKVKDSTAPVLVHVHTVKGLGCKWAEENKEAGHYANAVAVEQVETYVSLTRDFLVDYALKDSRLVIINAATPHVVGFDRETRAKIKNSFIDVGIAEEHAVAVTSGAGKGKIKPVMCVLSSFMQRTFDQLMQDLALNKTPATVLVYSGGLSSSDETHVGAFDIAMTAQIPNVSCFAPASKKEYLDLLTWSIESAERPVIIRVPTSEPCELNTAFNKNAIYNYQTLKVGEKVAIFALGSMLKTALKASEILSKKGINATVISASSYSHFDKETIEKTAKTHELVIAIENGVKCWSEKLASRFAEYKVKVLCRGGEKEYTDRESLSSQYIRYRLTPELIAEDVIKNL